MSKMSGVKVSLFRRLRRRNRPISSPHCHNMDFDVDRSYVKFIQDQQADQDLNKINSWFQAELNSTLSDLTMDPEKLSLKN